jgi:tetratricopeptide (TPR) repeat protein
MNKTLVKALIGFIVPIAVIYLLGRVNILLAVGTLLVYIAVLLYISRVLLYTMMGSRNYSLGKNEQALAWFKKAHESKKAALNASISYAYILLKTGDLAKSEEILQTFVKEYPKSPQIPNVKSNLALVLWKKGELDAAVAMLEEAIETYKTTSVYGSLGYLLILKGDLEKALQFNLEAHEYNSTDKIILDNLGQNYFMLGNYDKAREIYEPLVEKAPTFPEPYHNYGLLLEKLGDREKALEMLRKALNCKFSYLSSITREDVEAKIREISGESI